MFHKHEYFVVTPANDLVKTVLMFGVIFLIFGEIMYEKGKQANKEQK